MKRVKVGCVLQMLVFLQKEELNLSKEEALKLNREEVEHYKESLEKSKTRYQIIDTKEQNDASIIVHVRKHLNSTIDVEEYFN